MAGEPNRVLGEDEDDFYGRQHRLIAYALGNSEEGRTHGDSWINSLSEDVRGCVRADPVAVDGNTASVDFTVSDGCAGLELSLVSYEMPDASFSFETADEQELVDSRTATFGPGSHTLEVEAFQTDG